MNTNKQSLIALRKKAIEAPIGSEIRCPSCGVMHTKKAYNTIFCKSKGGSICKDNYWNNVTPTKRNNTIRISPANAAFQEERLSRLEDSFMYNMRDMDDDPSWDAHKDTM